MLRSMNHNQTMMMTTTTTKNSSEVGEAEQSSRSSSVKRLFLLWNSNFEDQSMINAAGLAKRLGDKVYDWKEELRKEMLHSKKNLIGLFAAQSQQATKRKREEAAAEEKEEERRERKSGSPQQNEEEEEGERSKSEAGTLSPKRHKKISDLLMNSSPRKRTPTRASPLKAVGSKRSAAVNSPSSKSKHQQLPQRNQPKILSFFGNTQS